jgi:integrase
MIHKRVGKEGVTYQVYGQRGGRKVYVGSYDSKSVAIAEERRWLVRQEQIAAGELPPEIDDKRTLGEAIDAWLKSLEASKSRAHRAYSEFAKYQIKPRLSSAPVAKLTKPQVMRWRDDLATQYAPTTVNSALACLSSAMSDFVDRGWITMNPCLGVRQIEVRERAYNWIKTRGELERLLGVCPDELRDMIAVAIGTGLRLDEMLHLAWDDVDLETRLITVQRGRQGTVKGGRIRHVPILDSVLPVFRQRALQRAGAMFVFPGQGGGVRSKTPVQTAYKAALKRAGLDTRLRWHDLRHTCASWWVLGGGDIFRLSRMLGHASVQITQRTYAHLAPEAWQQDYHRLAFRCPSEPAKVYEFLRDDDGKLAGKRAIRPGETAENAVAGAAK